METLTLWMKTPMGQAALSFSRVFAATVVGCWLNAGMPVTELSWAALGGWVELGIQGSVVLVLGNYLGPWEKRYGFRRGSAADR